MTDPIRVGAPPRAVPPQTRQKVLSAAADLLQQHGYAHVTMEGVAAHAGTAKTTVYRWWPSKAALLLDLFDVLASEELSDPNTGDTRSDLKAYLYDVLAMMSKSVAQDAAKGMFAEAQSDPVMKDEVCARFTSFRRSILSTIIDRGISRRELRADVQREILEELLIAPFWFRILVAHEEVSRGDCSAWDDAGLDGLKG